MIVTAPPSAHASIVTCRAPMFVSACESYRVAAHERQLTGMLDGHVHARGVERASHSARELHEIHLRRRPLGKRSELREALRHHLEPPRLGVEQFPLVDLGRARIAPASGKRRRLALPRGESVASGFLSSCAYALVPSREKRPEGRFGSSSLLLFPRSCREGGRRIHLPFIRRRSVRIAPLAAALPPEAGARARSAPSTPPPRRADGSAAGSGAPPCATR